MIIDWYTIIFQLINFLILVFLLRRFLYGPIIRTMDEREQKIVEREKIAEAEKDKAAEEAERYRLLNDQIKDQEEEYLEKARQSAVEEKKKMLDQARSEVGITRRRWEESFEREKESLTAELRRRIALQACSVARRCLEDLADDDLEKYIWKLFIDKLSAINEGDRLKLTEGTANAEGTIVLHSAFPPDENRTGTLEQILKDLLGQISGRVKVIPKHTPGLICGFEIDTAEYQLAWSIDSYLEGLEAEILKELEETSTDDEEEVAFVEDGKGD